VIPADGENIRKFLSSPDRKGISSEALMSDASILLIEDDLNVYYGLQRKLKASHYDTFYAPDAIASISQARQHHPDLILLDLGLPAGDGFVVMDRLKLFPELSLIPIIVLSGRDRAANEIRSLRAGATAFLQKPVNSEVLLETIRQCLAQRPSGEGSRAYSIEPSMSHAKPAYTR
jgi:DNA-binding response OmpR family regulator